MKLLNVLWLALTCWRHDLEFKRNIYGDEIIHSGRFKRSWWRCRKCGAWKSSEYLHNEQEAAAATQQEKSND